jgi:alkanesulfonate monooxygenase SsuD/methylene tetrahydromethanopterin reductase-like flavin-dependent oxidoreductase (luciferase family)
MDLAIGLPDAVPGTGGERLAEWARRAEARGFSSLGTIDRVACPSSTLMGRLGA